MRLLVEVAVGWCAVSVPFAALVGRFLAAAARPVPVGTAPKHLRRAA